MGRGITVKNQGVCNKKPGVVQRPIWGVMSTAQAVFACSPPVLFAGYFYRYASKG